MNFNRRTASAGFSLIELAIVLVVTGLLLQTSLGPLAQRIEHQRRQDAQEQLRRVQQLLSAHWVSHAHLPCPIPMDTNTVDGINPVISSIGTPSGSSAGCRHGTGGVPADRLGIVGPVDGAGALLDPWNRPLRYSVSLSDVNASAQPDTPDWLTPDTLATVNFTYLVADLKVCREALAGTCTSTATDAADLVAVVVSTGAHDTERELANRDGDKRFVSASYSSAKQYAFDDQLIWLSRSELIYLALQSGWLQ